MPKAKRQAGTILLWIAALGWAAILFFFSGQNANDSGRLSMWVTQQVMRIFPNLPLPLDDLHFFVRKTAHFCIFGLEGFLLGLAMMKSLSEKWLGGVLAVLACAIVAVLNEYHQSFSEGRSCEVRDMIIDSCGAFLGVLVGALLLHLIARFRKKRRNVIIS